MRDPGDLVVLSHLRWDWVWQRPQHLISRLARDRRTWFVEEPESVEGLAAPRIRAQDAGAVTRVWLQVPGAPGWLGFGDARAAGYADLLADFLPSSTEGRVAWLYTAMALPMAQRLGYDLLAYDVMDDLASVKGAAPEQRLRHHAALRQADVVFTGGRSLHAGVVPHRPSGAHCFPSGVDPKHYAPAIALRPEGRARPVAGYVGVIDERLDLDLFGGLAAALPEWDIEMVGPVAKINRSDLPQAPNLRWPGPKRYEELPAVMGGFDVALMPFALNEATKSISPTKTLEYLAAGLPVVSTRVADVVSDYSEVVDLQDDAAGFADACQRLLGEDREQRRRNVTPTLERQTWDSIAGRMAAILQQAAQRGAAAPATTAAAAEA